MDSDGWLDEDDPLTDEEKKLIDARLAEHEANPESAISLEEFNARIQNKFGRWASGWNFDPKVSADIFAAAAWYDEQEAGLSAKFAFAVEKRLGETSTESFTASAPRSGSRSPMGLPAPLPIPHHLSG